MQTVFITFGDSHFRQSKKRIANQVIKLGFDKVMVYGPENLAPDFLNKTSPYIYKSRGAGYWLWKPEIIRHTLDIINVGDILVYADSGCEINENARERFNDYINMLHEGSGILTFSLVGLKEYLYTKDEVFRYFDIKPSDPPYSSDQRSATVILFRKGKVALELSSNFSNIALTRPDLFSDDECHGNHPEFITHRHDQSVFSLLTKLYPSTCLPDETWSSDWSQLEHMPFLAKRIWDRKFLRTAKHFAKTIGRIFT